MRRLNAAQRRTTRDHLLEIGHRLDRVLVLFDPDSPARSVAWHWMRAAEDAIQGRRPDPAFGLLTEDVVGILLVADEQATAVDASALGVLLLRSVPRPAAVAKTRWRAHLL